jgi:hypothetical protein
MYFNWQKALFFFVILLVQLNSKFSTTHVRDNIFMVPTILRNIYVIFHDDWVEDYNLQNPDANRYFCKFTLTKSS